MWQHHLRDGDSRGHAGENDLVHDALADAAVTEAIPCGDAGNSEEHTRITSTRWTKKTPHNTPVPRRSDFSLFLFFFFLRTFSTIGS